MIIPTKKLENGFTMPVFGLGTWMMGGAMTRDTTHDHADITAIKKAIEAGITHIDTAEKYAEGHAEELVGKAIKGYDRKSLFLISKIADGHLHYNDVLPSLHNTLERMQTDYLDVYMIHSTSLTIPIEESMRALDEAMDRGLIRNIAVSNFTVERFRAAQKATKNKIVAGQYHLNLQIREAERKGIVNHFQENDVMFIAWRPIQKGSLVSEVPPIMTDLCKKYDKTPAQIAINWLLSQKNIVTLSKMQDPQHLTENLGALGWELEPSDVDRLTKEYPNQQDVSDAVPLKP